jgi:hypothetical protein
MGNGVVIPSPVLDVTGEDEVGVADPLEDVLGDVL